MAVSVGSNSWERDGNIIRRKYYISGMSGSEPDATLQINFSLELGASIHSFLSFRLSPFHLPRQQVFQFLFGTEDLDIGYRIGLLATSVEYRSTDFTALSRDDVGKCTSVLCAGKNMALTVLEDEKPTSILRLPNDGTFSRLYNLIYDELAKQQDGGGGPIESLLRTFGIRR